MRAVTPSHLLVIGMAILFTACDSTEENKESIETKVFEYYDDGALKAEGTLIENQKQGLFSYFYPSGNLEYEIEYRDDLVNGKIIEYFDNNEKIIFSEKIFKNGVQCDSTNYYSENGDLEKIEYYTNEGRLYYEKWFNSQGKLTCESNLFTLYNIGSPGINETICYDSLDKIKADESIYFETNKDEDGNILQVTLGGRFPEKTQYFFGSMTHEFQPIDISDTMTTQTDKFEIDVSPFDTVRFAVIITAIYVDSSGKSLTAYRNVYGEYPSRVEFLD